jgi:hypothetical protein
LASIHASHDSCAEAVVATAEGDEEDEEEDEEEVEVSGSGVAVDGRVSVWRADSGAGGWQHTFGSLIQSYFFLSGSIRGRDRIVC